MIPTLSILRGESTPEGTFGHAYFSATPASGFSLRTLELPDKGNRHGVSRIPAGTYRANTRWSPHFQRDVFLLENVPERDMIEIHPGNWGGDEEMGYYSDIDGCILVGFGVQAMVTPKGNRQLAVTRSKAALDSMFNELFDGTYIDVVITDMKEGEKCTQTT